ncbi:tRNA adenosine deaminase [Pseudonocardiaceae bacterium YIM PH 21723]|nr:tRNA adenosine deaminase [Pseudonocardiaceae bacterium YIM PH 21723]
MAQQEVAYRSGEQTGSAGFAVAVVRVDGHWRCTPMDNSALDDLDRAITQLRRLGVVGGAVFGLLDVDDEFFMIVRPTPVGVDLMLSDASAALDYDVAADVLDLLRVEPPEDMAEDEVWPQGDLGILADLGLPEAELELIVSEIDLYPDEQLEIIARRCGFAEELSAEIEDLVGV